MMNKKAGMDFTGVVISILIVMALFYGSFEYIITNYESANITEPIGYNQSYYDLQTSQANLSSNIEGMKSAAQNISEADGNAVSVAWNGLSGLAYTLRFFFGVIGIAVDVWNAVLPGLAFLPDWTKLLIEMGVIVAIVLIVIGSFKGESKT